jgi:hypothetical protein
MELMEPCRQSEIGQLYMTTAVEQDIIRLDITEIVSSMFTAFQAYGLKIDVDIMV